MLEIEKLITEQRNSKSKNLENMKGEEIALLMNQEDNFVITEINKIIPQIGEAIERIATHFQLGGRLIYIGAGTSGRLGVLDAAECIPTFGVSKDMVIAVIAGGKSALLKAVEGAEDSKEEGAEDLKKLNITKNDVVVGLAASGRTPYVIGALQYANLVGSSTIAISCNKQSKIGELAMLPLEIEVGPEILTGSTRLKAGTAQKMLLNMLSTGAMIRIGKVYENLMVDVQLTNEKLERRAENIIMEATEVDRDEAISLLRNACGVPKLAIIMKKTNCDLNKAKEKLNSANGFVSMAIK